MKRYIIYFLLGFCILSCSYSPEQKQLLEQNPTSYTFPSGLEEVKEKIETNLNRGKFRHMDLFSKKKSYKPLDSVDIFDQPGNNNDYFLSPSYSNFTIGKSKIYTDNDYIASFHLHLRAIDSMATEIEIKTINPKIIVGKDLLPSGPHFSRQLKYLDVKPSTIEEYEILLIVGKSLGQSSMPDLKLPNP
jgi:hypothetical protein